MPIKYDIDKLKSELIGKTINWITVTDVFKDDHNHTMCSYICRCGTSKTVPLKVIKSGKIKSCGCYKHSKEYSDHMSIYYNDKPDKLKRRSAKYKQWVEDNRDKIEEQGRKHSKFFSSNPALLNQYSKRMTELNKSINKEHAKELRISSIISILENNEHLYDYISTNDLHKLLSGDITANDKISTKCPNCGRYSKHNLRDIFNISDISFKQFRLCKQCFSEFSTSKYEDEIAEFISTFYNEEYVRNDRSILNGKELDLYYPENKIAIEFNGDYWHSELFKDKLYHFIKLKQCLDKNILLVSIFESEWLNHTNEIMLYLKDLFSGVVNSLSFTSGNYINNNYPYPDMKSSELSYSELSYKFKDKKVYTCGLSIIKSVDNT